MFDANHPFLFIIKEADNGVILFIGRFWKPLEEFCYERCCLQCMFILHVDLMDKCIEHKFTQLGNICIQVH